MAGPIEAMIVAMMARSVPRDMIELAVETAKKMAGAKELKLVPVDDKAIRRDFDLWFDLAFWPAYPKRIGTNPKKSAADKLFLKIRKNGENPDTVLAGLRRYRAELKAQGRLDSQFVLQAITWVNRESWKDDPAAVGKVERSFADIAADLRERASHEQPAYQTNDQDFGF